MRWAIVLFGLFGSVGVFLWYVYNPLGEPNAPLHPHSPYAIARVTLGLWMGAGLLAAGVHHLLARGWGGPVSLALAGVVAGALGFGALALSSGAIDPSFSVTELDRVNEIYDRCLLRARPSECAWFLVKHEEVVRGQGPGFRSRLTAVAQAQLRAYLADLRLRSRSVQIRYLSIVGLLQPEVLGELGFKPLERLPAEAVALSVGVGETACEKIPSRLAELNRAEPPKFSSYVLASEKLHLMVVPPTPQSGEALGGLLAGGAAACDAALNPPKIEGRRLNDLHQAVRDGSLPRVEASASAHPDQLNLAEPLHGELPIVAAPRHDGMIERLLALGADPRLVTFTGWSALHAAAGVGNVAAARALLDAGAVIELADVAGERPLHVAARYGRAEIVELLLEREAETDAQSAVGDTALHLAYLHGHHRSIELLLKAGASDALPRIDGFTAADWKERLGSER